MSDQISGIKNVPPTYPVKPVRAGVKDRKSGQRKKPIPQPEDELSDDDKDDHGRPDGHPSIDEYV